MKTITRKGFTLLEILLVMTLLSIITIILIRGINPNRVLSEIQDNQRETDALTIYQAIEQYSLKNNTYPEAIKNMTINSTLYICKTSASDCTNGTQINLSSILVPTYISKLPEYSIDPNNSGFYVVKDANGKIGVGGVKILDETTFVKGLDNQSFATVASPSTPPTATGGNITTINENGIWYKVHTFTTSGDFVVTNGGSVDILMVGGGGGGGSGAGGGGGAGGVIETQWALSASTYAITIGQGGAGGAGGVAGVSGNQGTNGTNTTLGSLLTAYGGGGGGAWGLHNGLNGASGGGGGGKDNGGGSPGVALVLDPSQGYAGGTGGTGAGGNFGGGGGGGAGEVGDVPIEWQGAAAGGNGIQSNITGVSTYYAGGGGGGAREKDTGWNVQGGNGGLGGGGRGGDTQWYGTPVQAGNANTGGGGGGGSMNTWAPNSGAAGGSGIVIIRYPTPAPTIVQNGLVLHLDAGNTSSYPGTGTTWTDLSGNNNNGTLVNGVGYNSGNGGSLVFDGVDDVVNGTITGSIFTGSFTQSAWVYKLNANQIWQGVFTNSSPATTNTHLMTFGNGSGAAPLNSVGTSQVGVSDNGIFLDIGTHTNRWLYIVITKTGSTLNIYCYKDGSLLQNSGTITWNGGNFATTNNYQIGRHWAGGSVVPIQGNIPQVSIYNRALTATEIQQNYNATKGRFGL